MDLEKIGCWTTGSFLDLPLILGCGDQLCQVLAASTRQLPPQKFDLTWRIRHHLLCQILLLVESVFEDQIVFPYQSRLVVAVSVLFLCVGPEIRQKFIQFLLRNFSSVSVFFTRSFSGLTSFQYARNVTTAFLVAFLVFSEFVPSIKFCISSSDNLEKRFLLASLGSKAGSVLRSAPVNQADVSTC